VSERFEAAVESRGGGGHVIAVPLDVPTIFGQVRAPVRGKVAGAPFRSRIVRYGDTYYLGLNRELRDAAGVGVGDTVQVELELDDAPREVEPPAELRSALDAEPELRSFYDGLSFTHRKEYARWVGEAKREETRRRRAERSIELLRQKVRTPR
jgi:Bacteriocin-protection, YdeI or OmpD-Associated/Domain of unknown function (DUF1905)